MSDLRRQLVELAKSEASQYGEAKAKSVIGKLMGKYPEFRSSSKEVMAVIDEVIAEVNSLDPSDLEQYRPNRHGDRLPGDRHQRDGCQTGNPLCRSQQTCRHHYARGWQFEITADVRRVAQ